MDQEQSDAAIIAEFRRRQIRQLITAVPIIVSLVLVVGGVQKQNDTVAVDLAALVGSVLFTVSIAFTLMNWRCPNCSRYLGRAINPAVCPRCGARLR